MGVGSPQNSYGSHRSIGGSTRCSNRPGSAAKLLQYDDSSMSLLAPEGVKVLTVAELTREVKALIEDGFPTVWVGGEVSNLSRPNSGHLYFTLKDKDSQLGAVVWRTAALRVRFEVQEGMQVIARGRLTVYTPRGQYQLVIDELYP